MEHTVRKEEFKKDLIRRLNRVSGQVEGIKNMIEDDRYCKDVLIQIKAVNKAMQALSQLILNDHLHHCVVDKIQKGDLSVLDEINDLLKGEF